MKVIFNAELLVICSKSAMKTPKYRRSLLDASPRTPTPFKNALAEIQRRNGPLRSMVSSFDQLLGFIVIKDPVHLDVFLPVFGNSHSVGRPQ